MIDSYPLSMLQVGNTAIIQSSTSSGTMRRRLLDLGFSTGATVKCVQRSPSGDPIAYSIRGTIIALRNETAQDILVVGEDVTCSLLPKSTSINSLLTRDNHTQYIKGADRDGINL